MIKQFFIQKLTTHDMLSGEGAHDIIEEKKSLTINKTLRPINKSVETTRRKIFN